MTMVHGIIINVLAIEIFYFDRSSKRRGKQKRQRLNRIMNIHLMKCIELNLFSWLQSGCIGQLNFA